MTTKRTRRLEVRVTRAEHAKLNDLAKHHGMSKSDVVRMLVAKIHKEMKLPGEPLIAKFHDTEDCE